MRVEFVDEVPEEGEVLAVAGDRDGTARGACVRLRVACYTPCEWSLDSVRAYESCGEHSHDRVDELERVFEGWVPELRAIVVCAGLYGAESGFG